VSGHEGFQERNSHKTSLVTQRLPCPVCLGTKEQVPFNQPGRCGAGPYQLCLSHNVPRADSVYLLFSWEENDFWLGSCSSLCGEYQRARDSAPPARLKLWWAD